MYMRGGQGGDLADRCPHHMKKLLRFLGVFSLQPPCLFGHPVTSQPRRGGGSSLPRREADGP
ncbi:protein of unknown function [Kyrpidia spormannii]|uniref:Uncharacterized protein n=1 Tax=Kyrpidia spormannii TaxID=2055160 RepID=A0A6F9ECM5_9BACL|nr:protein of unknown function [Kyrpidia spormannii]